MPVFLYQRLVNNRKRYLRQIRQVSLAGSGLIRGLWAKRGKPTNAGWNITSPEMVDHLLGSHGAVEAHEIIIDAAPSVQSLVDLVRVVDIHVYTYGDGAGSASWSNLMLRVKDACWEEGIEDPSRKGAIKQCFEEPAEYGDDILTFLYLHGDEKSWNWGRIGQMNGAFIHKAAREYFKPFF